MLYCNSNKNSRNRVAFEVSKDYILQMVRDTIDDTVGVQRNIQRFLNKVFNHILTGRGAIELVKRGTMSRFNHKNYSKATKRINK